MRELTLRWKSEVTTARARKNRRPWVITNTCRTRIKHRCCYLGHFTEPEGIFTTKQLKENAEKGLSQANASFPLPWPLFSTNQNATCWSHQLWVCGSNANAAPCTDNLELSKLAQTHANGWLECNEKKVCPVMWVSPPLHKCFAWEDVGQRNRGNIPAWGKLLAETMNHHFLVCCSSSTIITLLLHHFPPVFKSGQYCLPNVTAQAYNSVFWILLLR